MAYSLRRPNQRATGIVISVPTNPPKVNQFVAVVFQLSLSAAVAAGSSERAAASTPAREFTSDCRNALQVHHVISAITATINALAVRARTPGAKISRTRAGAARAVAFAQRSGSRTKKRTTNATAAGINPNSST